MRRLRIGLEGRILRWVPVHWTYTRPITATEHSYAIWLQGWLEGMPVKLGTVLTGNFFVQILEGP